MRYLACFFSVMLLLSTSTTASAQATGGPDPDLMLQDPALTTTETDDAGEIASRSDAVVIGRFLGAAGEFMDRDGHPWLMTAMRFQVIEALKNDPRLPSNGPLIVKDVAGGGRWKRSTKEVLALSETAQHLKADGIYFLFLEWEEQTQSFALTVQQAGVFDLTGNRVRPLTKTLKISNKLPTMEKAAAVQALKDVAMATGPSKLRRP